MKEKKTYSSYRWVDRVYMIDPDHLPIKATMCMKCLGKYIRTQDEDQETCLTCQKIDMDTMYTYEYLQAWIKELTPPPKSKILASNDYMEIYDDTPDELPA